MDSDLESGILCLTYHVCVIFALKSVILKTQKKPCTKQIQNLNSGNINR